MIGPKTNKIPEFRPVLRELSQLVPLAGHVINIYGGHTIRAHAARHPPRG